jgi:hypothetical protein
MRYRHTLIPRPHGRGFTLVELCLGLVVTAMVMSAVAALALAVSNCWKFSDALQSGLLTGNQALVRLQRHLHDAKRTGYSTNNPPTLVYWQADANGDGLMQLSELAMIAYNGPARTLDVIRPTVAPGDADATFTYTEFNDAGSVQRLRAHSTATPLVQDVTKASMSVEHANDAAIAPTVQVALTVRPATSAQPGAILLIAATLRGPAPAQ